MYRLYLSTCQEAEKTLEKSIGPAQLNIQRFCAVTALGLSTGLCQAGRQGAWASTAGGAPCSSRWITNKIQTEAPHSCQGQLRPRTELYSLGYYGLGKPESVRTSSWANANSFGTREGSIKTDNFAYSAFIIFSSQMNESLITMPFRMLWFFGFMMASPQKQPDLTTMKPRKKQFFKKRS